MTRPGMPRSSADRLLIPAYAVVTLYFTAPLLATGANLGVEDWDVLLFYHAAVIKSVVEYGRLPVWNPWYCGGNVLWQNPQVPLLSPAYLFATVVPLALAMKLDIVLHYLIGFLGMHVLLTRGFKLAYPPGVFFLACLFTLAGGPVFHLAVGHATFLPYFSLPWVLFFFLRGIARGALRDGVAAAAILAVAIYNGGIHITFMAALALTCLALASAILKRDARPLVVLAVVGVVAFLLAAPKLLPVAAFVRDARTVDTRFEPPGHDRMNVEMLVHAFSDQYQYRRLRFEGQNYGWHEYGNYLGPLGVLSIVASFFWIFVRRPGSAAPMAVALAVTAIVLLALAVGDLGPYSPYMLLRRLPIASQFRLPSRYSLVFVLFATAMTAAVWSTFALERAGSAGRFAAIVLVLASCALAYWNHLQFEGVFSLPPLAKSLVLNRPGEPAVDAVTDGLTPGASPMLRALAQNRAVLHCYEPLMLPGAVDASKPAVFAEGDADVADVVFAPGRIQFRALSTGPAGRVVLNERYVDGWRSDAGPFAIDPRTGLAFVALAPGQQGRITMWFVPPHLAAGAILFLAGLGLALLLWRRTLPAASMVQFTHAVR